ncbi:MAG TPA: hypothetical protein VGR32_05480 [Brevundimonas sp.]|jgi:hypothetical protein|uniref:hypothetical protein n=1 Tax=Brevundimonas sp. TaxID=1871086 RepID=UPI002DF0C144|nr:hypothetical protein [Brevundimonas sp.]
MRSLPILLAAFALTGCATAPRGIEGCRRLAAEAGHDLSGRADVYRIPHTSAAIVSWGPPVVGGPPPAECTLVEDRVTELHIGDRTLFPRP